jgi:hypothetical protein
MFDALTKELLDLKVTERGHAPVANPVAAFPICCSLALSLCSSCSSCQEKPA